MKPRRWFRFSLRTLFVLLTLFGVWLGVQVKWMKDREAALKILSASSERCLGLPKPAPWSIRLLGARGYSGLTVPIRFRPEEDIDWDISRLKVLFPEANVHRSFFGGAEFRRSMVIARLRETVANLEKDEVAARASAPDAPLTQQMTEYLRLQKAVLKDEEARLKAPGMIGR